MGQASPSPWSATPRLCDRWDSVPKEHREVPTEEDCREYGNDDHPRRHPGECKGLAVGAEQLQAERSHRVITADALAASQDAPALRASESINPYHIKCALVQEQGNIPSRHDALIAPLS